MKVREGATIDEVARQAYAEDKENAGTPWESADHAVRDDYLNEARFMMSFLFCCD